MTTALHTRVPDDVPDRLDKLAEALTAEGMPARRHDVLRAALGEGLAAMETRHFGAPSTLDPAETLPARMLAYRGRKGLSQGAAGALAGLSQSGWQGIETGARIPTAPSRLAIETLIGTCPEQPRGLCEVTR